MRNIYQLFNLVEVKIGHILYVYLKQLLDIFVFKIDIDSQVAGVKGLEPSTYRVTGDRSNQLSYTPFFLVGSKGLEPLTPSV